MLALTAAWQAQAQTQEQGQTQVQTQARSQLPAQSQALTSQQQTGAQQPQPQSLPQEPQSPVTTYPSVPDNDRIIAAIFDPQSPYNYTALITRYFAGDTTLTLEEYRHLYYGNVWQESYKPFESITACDRILEVLARPKVMELDDYREIIRYGNEVMEKDPFSPSNINFLTFAYGATGDARNEQINHHRLKMIKETIFSSGNGVKEKAPWHIIRFEHATDIMGSMDMKYRTPMVIDRNTEYFPLDSRGPDGERGYYFDYSRVFLNYQDHAPEGLRRSGLMFNGMPVRRR